MQVLNFIESLSLALSGAPDILKAAENALLGNKCSEIDVRVLLQLESLSEGKEVLTRISSECVRQMKGFLEDSSSESVNMSRVVPYLKDDIFAEEVKGIRRETLEAATPNQAASMNINNCSLFHLEGLSEVSQFNLRPECFAASLRSHLSSISSLPHYVLGHFFSFECVIRTIPVEMLKYPIPPGLWNYLSSEVLKSIAGFATEDWSSYINPSLPDGVLNLAITTAIRKVKKIAIKELLRRYINLNVNDHRSPDLTSYEVRVPEIGFLAFNLDSGAKVFVKEASSKDGKPFLDTEVYIRVKSGSDQDGDVGGLAHLLEHLVLSTPLDFGGQNESLVYESKKHSGLWMANGKTEMENTIFKVKVSDNFHNLCLVAKAFSVRSFPMTAVAAEIKDIESEYKFKGHTRKYFEMIYPHLHPQNPASNFASGNLLSLTRDDILEKVNEFYQSHYCAENMEIYISSPLPSEVAGYMIQEFFSELPRCEKKPHKELPSNIWASNFDDFYHTYKTNLALKEELYNVHALPCHEEKYICSRAIESIPDFIRKEKIVLSSGGIFYVFTRYKDISTPPLQQDSAIEELQSIYYKNRYGELTMNARISKVVADWMILLRDTSYRRFFYYGKLPKKLQGSSNLIKHPYSTRFVYSSDLPSKKYVKSDVYPTSFLSMKISLLAEKDFLKMVILKLAGELSPLLIKLSKHYALVYKELNPETFEEDFEVEAGLLRGELSDEFYRVFAASVMKLNNHQKTYHCIDFDDSVNFLDSRLDTLLGVVDSSSFYEDIGFPLQLDQWSCISKWKVLPMADVNVQLPKNDSRKSLQEVFSKYFPPVPNKKLVPVLPKAGEFFYLAAESSFDDNAVAFSFILDFDTKQSLSSLTPLLEFAVYFFFQHQNNSAYHTDVKVNDLDFRVIIQSFQDPHYLFNLFNRFIVELPNIFAKEFPQFTYLSFQAEKLRDHLLSDKCGAILIELWSSKELDWESRKEAHFRYVTEQKGDKLKVYHNYCDYPAIEIQ